MRKTCLFLINGLGLGNSTRSHALMEEMYDAGFHIHAITSGNGLAYLQDKPCLSSLGSMKPFFYSGRDGKISGWSTIRNIAALARIARTKRRQVEDAVERVRPDFAITDSEYTLAPLRKRGIPIIALNTSEMVVSEYLKRRRFAKKVASHFWFVEYPDYLFHRRACDLILSPFPRRTPTRSRKFHRIGLIVRRPVMEMARSARPMLAPREAKRAVFMLSGSVHASNIQLNAGGLPYHVDVVGRHGESVPGITFHGRLLNNSALLSAADVLVVNGGYSAVSEAFALGKPTYVIPVPGHAEQFVNASLVQDFGLGAISTEADILPQLVRAFERNRWTDASSDGERFQINGAVEACEAIERFLAEHNRRLGRTSTISAPQHSRVPAANLAPQPHR